MGEPVLLGTVTLDVLHEGPIGAGRPPVTLRWGGVMNNAACAAGMRGAGPALVTAQYVGELSVAVPYHLSGNRVRWCPLPIAAPLPLFHAQLVDGAVADMRFLGDDALQLLTPELLDKHRRFFDMASVLVAGTDCYEPTLEWLADLAADLDVPFWLLSADPNEVSKLHPGGRAPDFVATNLAELSLWAGRPLTEQPDVIDAARCLAAPAGRCLVTLGSAGALLVSRDDDAVMFQPAAAITDITMTVGAGDVTFGCLLAARLAGLDWRDALRQATALTGVFLRGVGCEPTPYQVLSGATEADSVPGA